MGFPTKNGSFRGVKCRKTVCILYPGIPRPLYEIQRMPFLTFPTPVGASNFATGTARRLGCGFGGKVKLGL